MTKYIIRDREAGNIIETTDSLEKAEKLIEAYEKEDRLEGNYTSDFYEIKKEQEIIPRHRFFMTDYEEWRHEERESYEEAIMRGDIEAREPY